MSIPISIKQTQSYPWSQSNHQTQNFKNMLRNDKINSIVQKANSYKQPKSKNHFKLQIWPWVNQNSKFQSWVSIHLKSDLKPMILSQITNTKILSLNTSKLKQFLSLKLHIEQIFIMEQFQKKKKTSSKKSPRIKNHYNENLQKC